MTIGTNQYHNFYIMIGSKAIIVACVFSEYAEEPYYDYQNTDQETLCGAISLGDGLFDARAAKDVYYGVKMERTRLCVIKTADAALIEELDFSPIATMDTGAEKQLVAEYSYYLKHLKKRMVKHLPKGSVKAFYPFGYKIIPNVAVVATQYGCYYYPDTPWNEANSLTDAISKGDSLFTSCPEEEAYCGIKADVGQLSIMKALHADTVTALGYMPVVSLTRDQIDRLSLKFQEIEASRGLDLAQLTTEDFLG